MNNVICLVVDIIDDFYSYSYLSLFFIIFILRIYSLNMKVFVEKF